MSKKFAFSLKEAVVYPGQGVGIITEITKKEIGGEIIEYYVIYLAESDMTVLFPVMGIKNLEIRRIVTKEEAEHALKYLSEEFDPMPIDWKARYQMNMDLFKSGKILDTASVVRSLYQRSKTKELPIQERKLYDSAYRIFHDEITAALETTKAEAETLIHSHLEPLGNGAPIEKYDSSYIDDDEDSRSDVMDDEEPDEDDLDDSDIYDEDE